MAEQKDKLSDIPGTKLAEPHETWPRNPHGTGPQKPAEPSSTGLPRLE